MIDNGILLSCLAASFIFMSFMLAVAHRLNRYDIIDPSWGVVFISIATVAYINQPLTQLLSVQSLVLLLIVIWGSRLFFHLYARWSRMDKEDKRYATLRSSYARSFGGVGFNMYVRVYLLQALLAVVICIPIIALSSTLPVSLSYLSFIGLAVWLVGFYFETVGDWQLARHLKKSKGTLMTKGLWKYTRHPNYFGEVTQWWGIFIIALALPEWWILIISPLLITALILFVSGIPLTERQFAGRPGWSDYARRTSKFLPLPPKKS